MLCNNSKKIRCLYLAYLLRNASFYTIILREPVAYYQHIRPTSATYFTNPGTVMSRTWALTQQIKFQKLHVCSTAVIPNLGYAYPQEYEPGHLRVRKKKKLNNVGKRHIYQQFKTRYKSKVVKLIWYNSNDINYKHFANMKGTIYGNRQPRGTQVRKGWEPL
jgi:hypothetical protein